MNIEMTRKLALLSSKDPFYMGWYLARYPEIRSMDSTDVASELGCLPEVLNQMSLSRSPRLDPPHFQRDVEAIADRFQARADALANIIRTVQVASEYDDTLLIAARDRQPSAVADGSVEYDPDDTDLSKDDQP